LAVANGCHRRIFHAEKFCRARRGARCIGFRPTLILEYRSLFPAPEFPVLCKQGIPADYGDGPQGQERKSATSKHACSGSNRPNLETTLLNGKIRENPPAIADPPPKTHCRKRRQSTAALRRSQTRRLRARAWWARLIWRGTAGFLRRFSRHESSLLSSRLRGGAVSPTLILLRQGAIRPKPAASSP